MTRQHATTVFRFTADEKNSLNLHVDIPGLTMPFKLKLEIAAEGMRIDLNGDAMAFLDLFYLNPAIDPGKRERVPQIVIDDWAAGANGDPVAFARYTPRGTRVVFEAGTELVEPQAEYDGDAWGYKYEEPVT